MRQWVNCLIGVLLLCCSTSGVNRSSSGSTPALTSSMSNLPVEVRMRRLHLMRPDLIPYPLDIEVVC